MTASTARGAGVLALFITLSGCRTPDEEVALAARRDRVIDAMVTQLHGREVSRIGRPNPDFVRVTVLLQSGNLAVFDCDDTGCTLVHRCTHE